MTKYMKRDHGWDPRYWAALEKFALGNERPMADVIGDVRVELQGTRVSMPDDKTMRAHMKRVRASAQGPTWSIEPPGSPDPHRVGPVLAWWIDNGATRSFTVEEARWISAIAHAAIDLGPRSVFWVARAYQDAVVTRSGTRDLDAFIAIAPWRGPAQSFDYQRACESGVISEVLIPVASVEAEAERRARERKRQMRSAGYEPA